MALKLAAQKRIILGQEVASLREDGVLPAELYGKSVANVHLSVKEKDFISVYGQGGENTIIELGFEGETRPVLVHDVQLDSLTGKVLSIDFYQVDLTKKVRINVPLEFVGESLAVKEKEGVLNKALDEVEVEALPANIPHQIEIDISTLDDFGKVIQVSDLKKAGDFTIVTDPETVIASVSEPRAEEEKVVKEMTPEDVELAGKKTGKETEEGGEAEGEKGKTGSGSET